jgi:hypothetical protein
MSKPSLNAMLLLSGFFISVGLITIMVLQSVVSGDSITPKQSPIIPQSTPLQWDPSLV